MNTINETFSDGEMKELHNRLSACGMTLHDFILADPVAILRYFHDSGRPISICGKPYIVPRLEESLDKMGIRINLERSGDL